MVLLQNQACRQHVESPAFLLSAAQNRIVPAVLAAVKAALDELLQAFGYAGQANQLIVGVNDGLDVLLEAALVEKKEQRWNISHTLSLVSTARSTALTKVLSFVIPYRGWGEND